VLVLIDGTRVLDMPLNLHQNFLVPEVSETQVSSILEGSGERPLLPLLSSLLGMVNIEPLVNIGQFDS